MENFLIWIQEFFASQFGITLTFTGIATTVLTIVGFLFYKYVLPKIMDTGLTYLYKILAKATGVPVEGVSDFVQELPIVNQLKQHQAEMQADMEIRLVDLKNKLVSRKLTESERIALQYQFDFIMAKIGDKLSFETAKILNQIEQAAKAQLKL